MAGIEHAFLKQAKILLSDTKDPDLAQPHPLQKIMFMPEILDTTDEFIAQTYQQGKILNINDMSEASKDVEPGRLTARRNHALGYYELSLQNPNGTTTSTVILIDKGEPTVIIKKDSTDPAESLSADSYDPKLLLSKDLRPKARQTLREVITSLLQSLEH